MKDVRRRDEGLELLNVGLESLVVYVGVDSCGPGVSVAQEILKIKDRGPFSI